MCYIEDFQDLLIDQKEHNSNISPPNAEGRGLFEANNYQELLQIFFGKIHHEIIQFEGFPLVSNGKALATVLVNNKELVQFIGSYNKGKEQVFLLTFYVL